MNHSRSIPQMVPNTSIMTWIITEKNSMASSTISLVFYQDDWRDFWTLWHLKDNGSGEPFHSVLSTKRPLGENATACADTCVAEKWSHLRSVECAHHTKFSFQKDQVIISSCSNSSSHYRTRKHDWQPHGSYMPHRHSLPNIGTHTSIHPLPYALACRHTHITIMYTHVKTHRRAHVCSHAARKRTSTPPPMVRIPFLRPQRYRLCLRIQRVRIGFEGYGVYLNEREHLPQVLFWNKLVINEKQRKDQAILGICS